MVNNVCVQGIDLGISICVGIVIGMAGIIFYLYTNKKRKEKKGYSQFKKLIEVKQ